MGEVAVEGIVGGVLLGPKSAYARLEDMMARFRLMQAIAISNQRFHAGEVVTDTLPLTVASDRHWPGLSKTVMGPGMIPLDASASDMKASSAFANEVIRCTVTGADSVGG